MARETILVFLKRYAKQSLLEDRAPANAQ